MAINVYDKVNKIVFYKKFLFEFGILSILYALEFFCEEENYEECQIIIDTIKSEESRLDIILPKVINNDTIKEVKETYKKFNMTGENAIVNSKHYASVIIDAASKYGSNI